MGAPVSENGPELAAEAHLEQHVQVFAVLECAEEAAHSTRVDEAVLILVTVLSRTVLYNARSLHTRTTRLSK
jgi:hypothetical protein